MALWIRCADLVDRRILLAAFAWTALGLISGTTARAQQEAVILPPPLHIHVIAACKEYEAETSLKKWAKDYVNQRDVRVTFSVGQDGDEDLPNLDEVAKADLLVLFARRLKLKPEPLAKIAARWEAGKPILGLRTASHAFDNETNALLDGQVFGGAYQNHLGDLPVEVTSREPAKNSPLLEGFRPFKSSKLYKQGELSDTATVLLDGRTGDETYPVAWTHEYRGGRMLYTSLGVQSDFEDPNFLRLLDIAVRWLTAN
ncbi:MAG TPA: ThuA domain-containing protein [Pirellulaceae bacterium]|jgi:type 1 glutamine amidotransferase|nr:ThuA domain-containing protein [Pirellulaceae bacterium]